MKYFVISFFALIVGFASCDRPYVDDCETWDGDGCISIKPDTGLLIVRLTINNENQQVLVKVYDGKIEDENEVLKVNTIEALLHLYLPVNRFYTVTASYKSGDRSIIAVDGDEIELKHYNICSEDCYVLKDGKVNVRLK